MRKIEHIMPPIGIMLEHRTRAKGARSRTLYAKVTRTDTGVGVEFAGKVYDSMSGAAKAAGGYSVDGWHYWKVVKG